MSVMGDFVKRRKAERYIREVFKKAEDLNTLHLKCSLWGMVCLDRLRNLDDKLPNFPDPEMRTFEQLGKDLDQAFADINIKFPDFT